MKKLYLVRHGESEFNAEKRWTGQTDVALTDKGRQQAEAIAVKLQEPAFKDIEKIYASDLKRAYETAMIINQKMNLELTADAALREINLGLLEGQLKAEIQKGEYGHLQREAEMSRNVKYPDGESVFELTERMTHKISEILNQHDSVLVVAHSRAIRSAIAYFVFNSIQYINSINIENSRITLVTFEDGKARLDLLNY